eukprot:scaffold20908_cov60-Phaeocystis_antarctica.AAC.3
MGAVGALKPPLVAKLTACRGQHGPGQRHWRTRGDSSTISRTQAAFDASSPPPPGCPYPSHQSSRAPRDRRPAPTRRTLAPASHRRAFAALHLSDRPRAAVSFSASSQASLEYLQYPRPQSSRTQRYGRPAPSSRTPGPASRRRVLAAPHLNDHPRATAAFGASSLAPHGCSCPSHRSSRAPRGQRPSPSRRKSAPGSPRRALAAPHPSDRPRVAVAFGASSQAYATRHWARSGQGHLRPRPHLAASPRRIA